MFFQTQTA